MKVLLRDVLFRQPNRGKYLRLAKLAIYLAEEGKARIEEGRKVSSKAARESYKADDDCYKRDTKGGKQDGNDSDTRICKIGHRCSLRSN